MSNRLKWAEQELKLAGYDINDPEDGPNRWLAEGTLELLKVFSEQGHSGMSAPFAIKLFETLANWKPIAPLTGEPHEWTEVGPDVWQNKRASNVFKGEDGRAYWSDGIVFWEWFTPEEGDVRFDEDRITEYHFRYPDGQIYDEWEGEDTDHLEHWFYTKDEADEYLKYCKAKVAR